MVVTSVRDTRARSTSLYLEEDWKDLVARRSFAIARQRVPGVRNERRRDEEWPLNLT
jgi:hypothetical protein